MEDQGKFPLNWTVGLTSHWRKFPEAKKLYLEQFRGMFLPGVRELDHFHYSLQPPGGTTIGEITYGTQRHNLI